MMFNFHVEEM